MADKKKPSGDNEVGYGKPPKEHQFSKGKSGNIIPTAVIIDLCVPNLSIRWT